MEYHHPVLANEIIAIFKPQPGDLFVDATLGNAGHTLLLLKAGATVIGLDADPNNLEISQQRIKEESLEKNFRYIHTNYRDIGQVLKTLDHPIRGIIFDLGLSHNQLLDNARGFSFNDKTSLDMRLDSESQTLTAENIINQYDVDQLYNLFSRYSQEKLSLPIAQTIVSQRKHKRIKTASHLAKIIESVYLVHHSHTKIHPATKVFMALRIEVNQEYSSILQALKATLEAPSTLVAIISFHSGEDRLVKQFIRQHQNQITDITPKAIKPSIQEIKNNRLSRSSLLRVYSIK